eukprot:g32429.t1
MPARRQTHHHLNRQERPFPFPTTLQHPCSGSCFSSATNVVTRLFSLTGTAVRLPSRCPGRPSQPLTFLLSSTNRLKSRAAFCRSMAPPYLQPLVARSNRHAVDGGSAGPHSSRSSELRYGERSTSSNNNSIRGDFPASSRLIEPLIIPVICLRGSF